MRTATRHTVDVERLVSLREMLHLEIVWTGSSEVIKSREEQ